MDSIPLHRRRGARAAAAALSAAALTLGGLALAAPAQAAENDVVAESGSLDWGYKASFRNYVANGGQISASDGATRSGEEANAGFVFPVSGGHVTDADNLTIDTVGAAQFTYTAHFFDVKLSNIQIVVEGGDATIVADTYLWAGMDFGDTPEGTHENEDVALADVANTVVTVEDSTVTVSGTGVTVSAEGAAANPLYAAGAPLDDFTVTAEVEGTGTTEPEPEPETGAEDIEVTVPDAATEPEPGTGSFGWAWASTSPVSLGTASETGGSFVASGALNDIVVTDTRVGGTSSYGWELTGSVSDFTSGSDSFSASSLGWTPSVTDAGAGVIAGPAAQSLSSSALLATSNAAASATVQAALDLTLPTSTPAGDYAATVTITAVG
ncbi:MAG: HtaA domain-containing protein [Actinomycetota bacterium]